MSRPTCEPSRPEIVTAIQAALLALSPRAGIGQRCRAEQSLRKMLDSFAPRLPSQPASTMLDDVQRAIGIWHAGASHREHFLRCVEMGILRIFQELTPEETESVLQAVIRATPTFSSDDEDEDGARARASNPERERQTP